MPEESIVIVSTTVASEAEAGRLASLIVGAGLAACVQFASVRSVYRWKGAVESADEYLLTAKTRGSLANEIVDFIGKQHAYDLPEIVVSPVAGGFEPYLLWVEKETAACDRQKDSTPGGKRSGSG